MRTVSEYVSIGHPDKMADFISESLLDYYIQHDKDTRFALEVQIKDNTVNVAGEVTSKFSPKKCELTEVVREAVRKIGYTDNYAAQWHDLCTNANEIKCHYYMTEQSPNIACGVNNNNGWGDQGIFWGMATTNDREDNMPHDIWLAKRICDDLYECKIGGIDIKSQVYVNDGKADNIVVAVPLQDNAMVVDVAEEIRLLLDVILPYKYNGPICVNGTGRYYIHGSIADCGTTGRKLAVDFYGGNCQIGGGSPWTKDYTKADLSLNVLARTLAVRYARDFSSDIKVGLACSIGSNEVELNVYDTKGNQLERDLIIVSPSDIAEMMKLDTPIYADVCKNGLPYYFEK